MNQLTFWGLIFGLVMVAAYVCRALFLKKKATLNEGAGIFIGSVALAGAIRLLGFVFSGSFSQLVKTSTDEGWWSAGSEDVAFVVLGGLALAWVSCEGIWTSFAKLSAAVPASAPDTTIPTTPDQTNH